MRKAFFCLLWLVLAVAPLVAQPDRTQDREHFRFHYDERLVYRIATLGSAAEEAYARLEEKLGFSPPGRIPVYLYADGRHFREAVGAGRTEMVVGVASSADGAIRIDASELFSPADRVIGHELVHIFLFYRLGSDIQNLPLWLHEGLANIGGGMSDLAAEGTVTDAYLNGRLMPLSDLVSEFPSGEPQASLAYAQGQDAVNWLLERGGWENMREFIERLRQGEAFPVALEAIYDVTPASMESQWIATLRTRARPALWAQVGYLAIIALWLGGLVWGYLTVRKHRRRREREEEEEPASPPPAWWPDDEEWRAINDER
jgi:hypothetical protein